MLKVFLNSERQRRYCMRKKSLAAVPLFELSAGREEEPGAGRGEEAAPPGGGQDGGTEKNPHHETRGGSIYNSHCIFFHFCFFVISADLCHQKATLCINN
jgi:hypothetical protein